MSGAVGASRAAYEARFDGLAAVAFRVAFRILGERSEAEDVAQESLAKAFLSWTKVESYAEPWVAQVAANQALGLVRRRRRDRTTAARTTVGVNADRVALVAALQALPKRQREVLVLRYLADLTEEAVAARLGISVGSVKAHAHRALRAARPLLEEAPTAEHALEGTSC